MCSANKLSSSKRQCIFLNTLSKHGHTFSTTYFSQSPYQASQKTRETPLPPSPLKCDEWLRREFCTHEVHLKKSGDGMMGVSHVTEASLCQGILGKSRTISPPPVPKQRPPRVSHTSTVAGALGNYRWSGILFVAPRRRWSFFSATAAVAAAEGMTTTSDPFPMEKKAGTRLPVSVPTGGPWTPTKGGPSTARATCSRGDGAGETMLLELSYNVFRNVVLRGKSQQ